jgi:hypothetical protein
MRYYFLGGALFAAGFIVATAAVGLGLAWLMRRVRRD